MSVPIDRVLRAYVRDDQSGEYEGEPEPVISDPRSQALDTRGIVLQNAGSSDRMVGMWRDANSLHFSDGSVADVTLADLMGSTASLSERLYETGVCDSGINVGDIVSVRKADGVFIKANPADLSTMPACGVVTAKPSANFATVQCGLLLRGVYTGLVRGPQYVSLTSRPTDVAPVATLGGHEYGQQRIGYAVASDVLCIAPDLGMFIDQL